MKVGDYVRTNDGLIGKLFGYNAYDENKIAIHTKTNENGCKITPVIDTDRIIKSSPNIMDLIEIEDYVNGYKVSFVDEEPVMGNFVQCDYEVSFGTTNHYRFYKADIKSIVTKEQFSQMEYRIGE